MDKSTLITALATLADNDPRLAAVAAALNGEIRPDRPATMKLLSMGAACDRLGVSRATLWRLLKEGRVQAVEIRKGSRRIHEAELARFIEGKG